MRTGLGEGGLSRDVCDRQREERMRRSRGQTAETVLAGNGSTVVQRGWGTLAMPYFQLPSKTNSSGTSPFQCRGCGLDP